MAYEKFIIVFTQAYNSGKTLERCINSVLSQTYKNIIYYIIDSGSTDDTAEIINRFASIDKRIIPFYYHKNEIWHIYSYLPLILNRYNKDDYFAQLDADDEYAPSCFEKLMSFMSENKLDIAACVSDFIDGVNGNDLNRNILLNDILVYERGFDDLFPDYFKFARDSWGKLFSLSVLENIDFVQFNKNINSGSVSYLSFEALRNADGFGVLNEKLHKYYIYPDSFERSSSQHKLRIVTPSIYKYYKNYLISKCGYLSYTNEIFLYGSYFRAISNKLPVILNSNVPVTEKMNILNYILTDELTLDMMKSNYFDRVYYVEKKQYLKTIFQWIDYQGFLEGTKEFDLATEILDKSNHTGKWME